MRTGIAGLVGWSRILQRCLQLSGIQVVHGRLAGQCHVRSDGSSTLATCDRDRAADIGTDSGTCNVTEHTTLST